MNLIKKKQSILYLTLRDFPRRVANRVQTMKMAEALSNYYDVTLTVSKLHISLNKIFDYYGIKKKFKIHQFGEPKFGSFTIMLLPSILKFILIKRPNLIFVREEYPAFILSLFFNNIIYEMHDLNDKKLLLYKLIVKKSRTTISTSIGLVEKCKKLGISTKNMILLPNGFDTSLFSGKITKPQARRKLNLNSGKNLVIYSGRFSEHKGIYTLIDSAKYLSGNYLVILVGGFEGEEEIVKKYILDNNINDRVLLYSHQEHSKIPLFLKAADVLVLPNSNKNEFSRTLTSPIKLFEYMASRRPIIASKIPSICNVINENIAFFVDPDSPISLANKIKYVVLNTEKADKLSNNAFTKVKSLSWSKRADRLMKTLSTSKK